MTTPLTQLQQRVLDFVRAFRAQHQAVPTRVEIAKHFGWKSPNSADLHIRAIAHKGHIRIERHRIFDLGAPDASALHAAAPDLLAALERALLCLQLTKVPATLGAIDQASSAIAKAHGRLS